MVDCIVTGRADEEFRWVCYLLSGEHDAARKIRLGCDAQRAAVATYLNGGDWKIVAEFTEVESGKRSDRPELDKALAAARLHRVPLVVSKVDRLDGWSRYRCEPEHEKAFEEYTRRDQVRWA